MDMDRGGGRGRIWRSLDTAALQQTDSEYKTNAAALCLAGAGGRVKSALGVSRPWITAEQNGAGQLAD